MKLRVPILFAAMVMVVNAGAQTPAPEQLDFFEKKIRPVLSERCYECHSAQAKKLKGSLFLDSKDGILNGGDNGPAVITGDIEKSLLIKAVRWEDKDTRMPPKKKLSNAEIADLESWVKMGAPDPRISASVASAIDKLQTEAAKHWAFRPLKLPPVPTIANRGNPGANPIDAFIIAKLAEKDLAMSPEADARTLCRRLYFDLTGLPPTLEEVEAFAQSAIRNPNFALESLVDQLLASPRYGERWARHWLDVVHYGESHGYDKDRPRLNAWPYRDYVIRAFNNDKPYARFVQEQIAGDALFPGTTDGITALGFIAAGPWDAIGHQEVAETKIDGKIARHLDRDDMVSNTINTFASLTVHCAQCHDHKFDPITQEDYYSLQAVFAALDRTEVSYYADDALMRRYVGLRQQVKEATDAIAALEEPLRKQAGDKLTGLNRSIAGASVKSIKPEIGGYHSALSPEQDAVKWVQVDLGRTVGIENVTLLPCYDDFNEIGAGFGFPVRFKVEASDDPEFKSGVALLWKRHDQTFMTDFRNPGLSPFVTGGACDDGIKGRYVRVTAVKLAPRKDDFICALAELQVFDASGANVAQGRSVTALDSLEASPRWGKTNLTDGIAPKPRSTEDKQKLTQERTALLLSFADAETKSKLASQRRLLRESEAELKKLPPPSHAYIGAIHNGGGATFRGTGPDGGKPRPIFVLARGDVQRPGKPVGPGAISAIAALPARFELPPDANESDRRAALAKWLTDDRNPLTWRSIVNRVWQYHFGHGIVETPNDFGKMGAAPTHPELLDWLAVTFRDDMSGSLKKLHRLIVTSATYRQSATVSEASAGQSADVDNHLLWRMNRRKLEAESIRDSILAAAGQFDLTMAGPSFQDFVMTQAENAPHYEYQLADPEDPKIHRRSIYRFIGRSQQQPWMATMDCADPSILVDRRTETITPLQSLAQLNNQLIVAMAGHFAERVSKLGATPEEQVAAAIHIVFQRDATAEERAALANHARQHGLTNACRAILNLNEFVFVD